MTTPVGRGNTEFYAAGVPVEVIEELCRLNLESHHHDIGEFFSASWNLADILMRHVAVLSVDSLTYRQRASIYFLGRSQRLMRAVHKLLSTGMWPEAEMLLRAHLEAQVELLYILEVRGENRAQTWLSRTDPSQRWPFSEMSRVASDRQKKMYKQLSPSVHSHVLSQWGYLGSKGTNDFFVEVGPLANKESLEIAAELQGHCAMLNAAICELAYNEFPQSSDWKRAHSQLMQMPYFMSLQPQVEEYFESMTDKTVKKQPRAETTYDRKSRKTAPGSNKS